MWKSAFERVCSDHRLISGTTLSAGRVANVAEWWGAKGGGGRGGGGDDDGSSKCNETRTTAMTF